LDVFSYALIRKVDIGKGGKGSVQSPIVGFSKVLSRDALLAGSNTPSRDALDDMNPVS
jgi:hypothetical protein